MTKTIKEHRVDAIVAAANDIQNLAKQLMFNNSLRGRNITALAQTIKDNAEALKTVSKYPEDGCIKP